MFWFSWPDWCLAFFSILLEGVPFLLLGAMVSVLVNQFLSPALLKRLMPSGRWSGILVALLAAGVFPLCECSAIPVVRRLIQKGINPAVATVYLLASPLLNPLSILSTWLAFRGQDPWLMVGLRAGLGVLVILMIAAWITRIPVEKLLKPEALQAGDSASPGAVMSWRVPAGMNGPWSRAVQILITDFLTVLPFLVLGAGVAAWVGTGVNQRALGGLAGQAVSGPVLGVVLSQILCLCSTTDAFVAAAMPVLSIPGKLAFLIAGPLFDLKLVWLYQVIYTRGFVRGLWWRVVLGTLAVVMLYALRK
jgi:uncharacterized membrane protein YraQ (UPF0718 family)